MISRNLFKAYIAGLGNGENPIFPNLCYRLMDGVNLNEGEPNFDLTQLAIECMGKRIQPRFVFCDSPAYPNKYEAGTMGCVDGNEMITYQYGNVTYTEPISRMWTRVENEGIYFYGKSEYVLPKELLIFDGMNGMVKVKTAIKNPDMGNWVKVSLENGYNVFVTSDHPFYTENRGRTKASNLVKGDYLCVYNQMTMTDSLSYSKVKIDSVTSLGRRNRPSYDVETETDTFTLSFIRSGNCRTAVRSNVNGSSTPEARGNLAFTTLNLPYIALEAKRNVVNKHLLVNEFFRLYNILIDDAIDELHARYDIIKNLKVKDVPFVSDWYQGHEGLTPNDTIEPMVKNGTLSVGFIGLAEALTVLTGKHHGESEQAQRLGLQIVSMLRKKMDKETAKSHLNWSCFATPAESACYTLLNAIKREFGVVKGVSDKDYLTNSCHIPVSFKCDMKTKIDIEAPYHLLCNAGAIFYLEAPSSPKFNPEGCLHLLQYMAKSGIVYGGLNYEHDFCVDCGEQGTFNVCPKCGSKNIRMTKIITGYLSTSDKFNPGKVAEARDRVSHT